MATQYELIKVVAQAVVARREGDKIVGEDLSPQVAFYSPEDLAAFYTQQEAQVRAANTANRKQRRQRSGS